MKAAPEGVIGGGQNTTAGPNTSAGANTVTKNTGKAEANNPQTPAPQRTPQPDGLGNLQQPALAGGAPMGQSASMPNYGGQAAQEAALVKNALSQNAPVNVIPMSVSGAPIASGAMGSMRGRAFGSNALGHLRGMTGYNSNMQGSNYDQSAQNAINQFDNNGIASGGGISQGGLTSGTPDLLSGGNNNSPSSPGGVGGGAGSNSPTGDIPTVCSPDQINKGWVSNGASCVAGPTANTATNTTPWQSDLNWANILLMGAAAITGYLGFMVLWGESLLSNPFTATEGVATLAHAALLTTAAGLMAGGAMALAIKIGLDGGTQQAIQIGIEGAAIGTGLALDWTGFCGWAIVASLVPFIGSLTSLIGIGI